MSLLKISLSKSVARIHTSFTGLIELRQNCGRMSLMPLIDFLLECSPIWEAATLAMVVYEEQKSLSAFNFRRKVKYFIGLINKIVERGSCIGIAK